MRQVETPVCTEGPPAPFTLSLTRCHYGGETRGLAQSYSYWLVPAPHSVLVTVIFSKYHKYWAYKPLAFCQAAVSTILFLSCKEPELSPHASKGEENGSCSVELMRMPTLIWKQPCLWEVKFLPYKLFWVPNRSGIIIYKNNKTIFSIWQYAFPNRLSCEAGTDSWDSVLLTNPISLHNRTAGVTQQQTPTAHLQLCLGGGARWKYSYLWTSPTVV